MANLTKEELKVKFDAIEEQLNELDVEMDNLRLNDIEGQEFEHDIDSKLFQAGDKIQQAIQMLNEAWDEVK